MPKVHEKKGAKVARTNKQRSESAQEVKVREAMFEGGHLKRFKSAERGAVSGQAKDGHANLECGDFSPLCVGVRRR